MIKTENVRVYNIARAVYSARNAMNSWDKSDSDLERDILGDNDLALARKLCRAGSDHRKFLRQIMVSMDITAPLYWWKEFDTYKVGTVANSCSTMHTIHKKEFTMDDFSTDRMTSARATQLMLDVIDELNENRKWFNVENDPAIKKNYFNNMIQLLPTSYNQKRTVTLNYEVLLNMYHARKAHKLDEWVSFCEVIAGMPYFAEICLENNANCD